MNERFDDIGLIDDDIQANLLAAEEACSGGSCTLPPTMELKIRVCNFHRILGMKL